MKPHIVVFSSSESYPIAEGIAEQLNEDYVAHPWKGEFFGENKTTPIWTFFKKLFHYDYSVIVLSDDKIEQSGENDTENYYYPKDNVLFELGASMARLGPQKTILIVPEFPLVKLPGYFDDVKPRIFTYKKLDGDNDKYAATISAVREIKHLINQAGDKNFHSELPAQGLAHAYLLNFLRPVIESGHEQLLKINGEERSWQTENGLTFTIIIPAEIMGRNKANDFFDAQKNCHKTFFKAKDGRDFSVYVLPRTSAGDPLHILDIPTTLLTAEEIIGSIETFWRETDSEKILSVDDEFTNLLKQREILNFHRTLEQQLKKLGANVYIVSSSSLDEHIASLQQ